MSFNRNPFIEFEIEILRLPEPFLMEQVHRLHFRLHDIAQIVQNRRLEALLVFGEVLEELLVEALVEDEERDLVAVEKQSQVTISWV